MMTYSTRRTDFSFFHFFSFLSLFFFLDNFSHFELDVETVIIETTMTTTTMLDKDDDDDDANDEEYGRTAETKIFV